MAEIKNIDNQFAQIGPVCVMASYSAIINYFSDGSLSIDDVLNRYAIYAGIDITLPKVDKETAIKEHYHDYCIPIDMRGFDYLAVLVHDADLIGTKKYCRIVKNAAEKHIPIALADKLLLRDDLKTNDRLAMGITPSAYGMHARVFGWDDNTQLYFVKDPEIAVPAEDDFLMGNEIYEYILFERV